MLKQIAKRKLKYQNKVQTRAPAKLIISGEHAVVYGQPALAMAVDRFAKTTISNASSKEIFFDFPNLNYAESFTLNDLYDLKGRIETRYAKFLNSVCPIAEVMENPSELLVYAFIYFCARLNLKIKHGLVIDTSVNFPIACGMGSSAAMIISLLQALASFFAIQLSLEDLFILGREVENVQHGCSSGLDIYLAIYGGYILFQNGKAEQRDISKFPMLTVATGQPETSTGECVSYVAKYLHDAALLADFFAITSAMDAALQIGNIEELKRYVRANHELLCRIGVVPEKIRRFVNDLAKLGMAAKICGAGAISGEKGGMVLCIGNENNFDELLQRYGYKLFPLLSEKAGVKII